MSQGHKHVPPFDAGFLRVSALHQLHYSQHGNPSGKPVVVIHGGPGGSTCPERDTPYFDPAVYRVVLFDQRGAGQSLPAAELRENTSQLLVADIETLRQHLAIPHWAMVFGGSWGSTLALLYAQTHPASVGALVLRGVFTERRAELAFSRGANGAARVFPEDYAALVGYLPVERRQQEPWAAYYELVTDEGKYDYEARVAAARAWCRWDLSIMKLVPDQHAIDEKDDVWLLQHARIETHYAVNGGFMEDGQLLRPENLARIRGIPCKKGLHAK
jgi:proline iminopeptidase